MGLPHQPQKVTRILEADLQMRHGPCLHEFLVHIRLEGQFLNIDIVTQGHEPFPARVALVIGVLHLAKNAEHCLVLFHEQAAGEGQICYPSGFQGRRTGCCGHTSANHCIIDAFTAGRRHNTGRITGEHHVTRIVPETQRLERDWRAFPAQGFAIGQSRGLTQSSGGLFQVHALNIGAHADRGGAAMREHPAVKVGADRTVIDHVAAHWIVDVVLFRSGYDLVIGKDQPNLVAAWDLVTRNSGIRAIGPDDQTGFKLALFAGFLVAVDHPALLRLLVAVDPYECACEPYGPGRFGTGAQEGVEILAIDHADKAVLDGNVHVPPGGRDHARGVHLGDQLLFADVEILHQARGNGAATGLDPALTVQKRHAVPGPGKVFGGGCTRWATAHDNNIIHGHSPAISSAWTGRPSMMRNAMKAAHRNNPASNTKTAPKAGASVVNVRMMSAAAAPVRPPKPAAMACAAPQRPMRVPARFSRPSPASAIIDPMAATAKVPLKKPRANTAGSNVWGRA